MKKSILTLIAVAFASSALATGLVSTNSVEWITWNGDNGEIAVLQLVGATTGDDNTLTIESKYSCQHPSAGLVENVVVKAIGGSDKIIKKGGDKFSTIVIEPTNLNEIRANAFQGMTKVTSLQIASESVPSLGANAFPTEWKTSCNLLVPENAKDAYKSAWGAYFKTVNGETIEDDGEGNGEGNEGENTPTGIKENNAKSLNIHAVAHKIVLNRVENIQVFSITGAIIYKGNTNEVEVDNAGIYIVKTPSSTHKILVKE